jgi:hypothetical protein
MNRVDLKLIGDDQDHSKGYKIRTITPKSEP